MTNALTRPTAEQVLAARMREEELEEAVRGLCAVYRLSRYHTRNSRKSDSGWPDDVIAGPGGVLFRELKRQNQGPRPSQDHWLSVLSAAGFDVDVWRPSDLLSGRIDRELRKAAGR